MRFRTAPGLAGYLLTLRKDAAVRESALFKTLRLLIYTSTVPTVGCFPGFSGFGPPSVDADGAVFHGFSASSSHYEAIYASSAGCLAPVADNRHTSIPGGTGTFQGFGLSGSFPPIPTPVPPVFVEPGGPKFDAGAVAFWGRGADQEGIYLFEEGSLGVVADLETSIPGGSGTFVAFRDKPSLAAGSVAFAGFGSGQSGIYLHDGDSLRLVADLNTPIPGGTGNFTNFTGELSTDGVRVAFRAFGEGQEGIYFDTGGSLIVVADRNTPVPGGMGNFDTLESPAADGGAVAFTGVGSSFERGIYLYDEGALSVIVDRNTPVPGGAGQFHRFWLGPEGLDEGAVAFLGGVTLSGPQGTEGIYLKTGSSITTVDTVPVNIPSPFLPFVLGEFSPPSLAGGSVAYHLRTRFFSVLLLLTLEDAVYRFDGTHKHLVADLNTPIPSQPCP
jgi:hypothetical protein